MHPLTLRFLINSLIYLRFQLFWGHIFPLIDSIYRRESDSKCGKRGRGSVTTKLSKQYCLLTINLIFYLPPSSVTVVQRGNWPCPVLHVCPLALQYLLSFLSLLVALLSSPSSSPSKLNFLTSLLSPSLSLSCLPCLASYLRPHGVVHQPALLSPDWASVPGFLTSRVQVSSVSTSKLESPPQSHSCRPSESVRRLCPGYAL